MKILIDFQVFQTQSSSRGLGRYSFALVKELFSIIAYRTDIEIVVHLNSNLPEISQELSDYLSNVATFVEVRKFKYFLDSVGFSNQDNINHALFVRNIALFDGVLLLSPFEFGNHVVLPETMINSKLPWLAAILYDFIPLIFKEHYGMDKDLLYKQRYNARLNFLQICNRIFAISEHTRKDAIDLLNINPNVIINIRGGISNNIPKIEEGVAKIIKQKYGIKSSYIMYVSGNDIRKNTDELLRAYAMLRKDLQEHYYLVIVCSFDEMNMKRFRSLLKKYSLVGRVIFTGYVSDQELSALYDGCTLFVFPSLYEGLGLPVLEAIQHGVPAIVSNVSSLPELVGLSDALFDPQNAKEIALKMERSLLDVAWRQQLLLHQINRLHIFDWKESASMIADVLCTIQNKQ